MAMLKRREPFIVSERGLIATLFGLYLVATAALSVFSFYSSQTEQLASTRSMLLTAARAGGHIIGRYFHDIYALDRAPGDVHYRLIVESLDELVADLPDVEYVYSMDMVDGQAYFIVSNETGLDRRRGTLSVFYNPYDSAPEDLFQAYSSGEPVFSDIYDNEWGTFRSAFVPTRRADGTLYIMAADIKIDSRATLLTNSIYSSALIALLALLPLYPLMRTYRRLQRRREEDLERELYYDAITGLPDITGMQRDLAHSTDQDHLSGILINLDEFHAINTLFGYDAGDRLLNQVADAIKKKLPSGARLYRSLIDEYFVLLPDADEQSAMRLAQTLLDTIFEPIEADDRRRITVTARAGVALAIEGAEELLLNAREAMDEARRQSQEIMLYHEGLHPQKRYAENLHWLNEVNDAFRQGRLNPWFQPICETATGAIRHYEALARLTDSRGEIHTPFHFLPAIRKSHLYRQLTCAMIEQSFQHFAHSDASVSINLTRYDLLDETTIAHLITNMHRFGMEGRVIIEVIESESIDYQDEVLKVLKHCKQQGIRIAIDDFGSGYSNFDQILKIDADYLKIDGSLIRRLQSSRKAQALVEAITRFAHSLNIPMIAEFVEDTATITQLQALGVQYVQGYAIGRPTPAEKTELKHTE
ncbi:bifunctional diguanylate cyclase/phosphodiesterase [Marinobacterium litorale]|uniref:bifunctional diguanylate cyclase/phosphodiesterase n=1 Tax=Marinobacterium litorale TaxID=404770 RepID=UPI00040727C0|nr:bifunctional diguanylate cyclase/phosphodiesterase [Marinobacterium litorale]